MREYLFAGKEYMVMVFFIVLADLFSLQRTGLEQYTTGVCMPILYEN